MAKKDLTSHSPTWMNNKVSEIECALTHLGEDDSKEVDVNKQEMRRGSSA
jgi:hypothetical protein